MARTTVGVLRGGTSNEYGLSLKTGAAMLSALPEEKYQSRDILIDKTGAWHLRGIPVTPVRALSQVDVVLNGLHGGIGEDGTIHRILERLGVPYAGSAPLASGMSLNKVRSRQIFRNAGITMPRAYVFNNPADASAEEMANSVFSVFGPPYVVKPTSEGSSNGIRLARTIIELADALAEVLNLYRAAIVEEYVIGEHATVGIIHKYRGEDLYALPPAHHKLKKGMWHFAPAIHEEGLAEHHVPSSFSHEHKKGLAEIAILAHKALGLAHFSESDFVLSRRGPYLLETNSTPHLYKGAVFPKMLESVGSSVKEFLEHSIALARA